MAQFDHSDEPVLLRSDPHAHGLVIQRLYVPPLDGQIDDRDSFDKFIADEVQAILQKHYPGYPWKCECNSKHGIIHFHIPILMGPTLKWAIRLAEWADLNEKLVRDGGGQTLERLGLRRGLISTGEFSDVRKNLHRADFADVH